MTREEYDELKVKAELGDVEAQYKLGYELIHDEAEIIDYAEAAKLFCKAALCNHEDALNELTVLALSGHIPAQYWLGKYYAKATRGKRNYDEAARWYSLAVERRAFLENEEKISEDCADNRDFDKLALDELTQLAERDISDAQFYLSFLYKHGTGVPQNDDTAKIWLDKAEASQKETAEPDTVTETPSIFSGFINGRVGQTGLAFIVREQNDNYVMSQEEVDRIKKETKKEEDYIDMLYRLIREQDRNHVEVYHSAWLKKNNWNTLITGKSVPVIETFMALAISLKLDIDQTEDWLKRAGYAFNPNSLRDNIVKDYITKKRFDIGGINATLTKNGFGIKQLLGTDIAE